MQTKPHGDQSMAHMPSAAMTVRIIGGFEALHQPAELQRTLASSRPWPPGQLHWVNSSVEGYGRKVDCVVWQKFGQRAVGTGRAVSSLIEHGILAAAMAYHALCSVPHT